MRTLYASAARIGPSAALLVGIILTPVGSAAADAAIGLSRDGRTWAATLGGPLLESGQRWVPGDRAVEAFFVRNQGPSAGRLTVEVRSARDRLLAGDAVSLTARVDNGPWTRLTNGAPSAELTETVLARGDTAKVEVAVHFARSAPADTAGRRLPLGFRVYLAGTGGPGPGHSSPPLPGTGTAVPPWLVGLGAALVGVGSALIGTGRKERRHA